MPGNATIRISSIFWGRAMAELIKLSISAAMFFMIFHRLMWRHSFYHILVSLLYHEFPYRLIYYFDTAWFAILLTSDNYRYQTCKRNIKKIYICICISKTCWSTAICIYALYVLYTVYIYCTHTRTSSVYVCWYGWMDGWDGRIDLIVLRGQTVVLVLRPCSAIA